MATRLFITALVAVVTLLGPVESKISPNAPRHDCSPPPIAYYGEDDDGIPLPGCVVA